MEHLQVNRSPQLPWLWIDQEGKTHLPSEMETSHLFYTLRMIWNNRMPREYWVGKVKLYKFGRLHNNKYLLDAIERLAHELATRNDLSKEFAGQLKEMSNYFQELIDIKLIS